MVRKYTDAEEYHDWMECIESDIMQKVLSKVEAYDPMAYTEGDVLRALAMERLDESAYGALLSPAATRFLERIAERARETTRNHFGNSVNIFTPMYASNYCPKRKPLICWMNMGFLRLKRIWGVGS